jgi:hypothetical protein
MNAAHQKYFAWLVQSRLGELPPDQVRELSQHLDTCPECAVLQNLSGQFNGLAGEFRTLAPPPGTFLLERQPLSRLDRLWARLSQPVALLATVLLLVALAAGLNFGIQRLIPGAAAPEPQIAAPGVEPGRGQETTAPQVGSPGQDGWLESNTELLAFIVFFLLAGAGLLVLVVSPPENQPRDWLLFLLLAWSLLIALAYWSASLQADSEFVLGGVVFETLIRCLPLVAGALVVQPFLWGDRLAGRARRTHALLAWGVLGIGVIYLHLLLISSFGLFITFFLVPGIVTTAKLYSGRGGQREAVRDLVYALIVLLILFLFAFVLPRPTVDPSILPMLFFIFYFVVLPVLLVGLFARWLYLAVQPAQRPPNRLLAAQALVALLGLWLLVCMIKVEWALGNLSDDPAAGLTSTLLILAAACAGVYLVWQLRGPRRLSGLLFAALVIAAVFPYRFTFFSDYYYEPLDAGRITEERAARILAGLEDYHDRTGVYPLNLWQLAPLNLLYIPKPVMYTDLGWCYQSDGDGYRFGYVYKPGYNVPREYIELREFSGGEPQAGGWICDQQFEMKRADAPSS